MLGDTAYLLRVGAVEETEDPETTAGMNSVELDAKVDQAVKEVTSKKEAEITALEKQIAALEKQTKGGQKKVIEEKDAEIAELKKVIEEKDAEIAALKNPQPETVEEEEEEVQP
jgi:hypothetical protein